MTHHPATPRTHEAPEHPSSRRPWAGVVVLGALLGLLAAGIDAWGRDCAELECIGTALVAVATAVVVLPLAALLGLALLRVPGPLPVAAGTVAAGIATGLSASYLEQAVAGPDHPVALPLLVAAGALAAPAGLVLGGPGFAPAQRVGVVLGLLVLVALSSMPLSAH